MRFFLLAIAAAALLYVAGCDGSVDTNEDIMPDDNSSGSSDIIIEAECVTDADCATAGCSMEVCTTAEEAPMILTTCEFKDEYRCFGITTCGCIEGKCSWAQTDEYASCLDDIQKE